MCINTTFSHAYTLQVVGLFAVHTGFFLFGSVIIKQLKKPRIPMYVGKKGHILLQLAHLVRSKRQ